MSNLSRVNGAVTKQNWVFSLQNTLLLLFLAGTGTKKHGETAVRANNAGNVLLTAPRISSTSLNSAGAKNAITYGN